MHSKMTEYRQVWATGALGGEECGSMLLSQFRWEPPERVGSRTLFENFEENLIFIATESSGSGLCWIHDQSFNYIYEVFADEDVANVFATSLAGATFRAFAEDLSGSSVPRTFGWSIEELRRNRSCVISRLSPFWESDWTELVVALLGSNPTVSTSGIVSFIDPRMLRDLITKLVDSEGKPAVALHVRSASFT
jgi:hypothetical protein